ncbi:hypothetical protein GO011_06325 [Mycobacterium sp. 20091114027_K0903767]|nr:hypothetical protein [Mycobacterium sp. 20091114027_K0903767]
MVDVRPRTPFERAAAAAGALTAHPFMYGWDTTDPTGAVSDGGTRDE